MTNSNEEGETTGKGGAESARTLVSIDDGRIDSAVLFAGRREIFIDHAGETYRLRRTAQNKLILMK